MRHIIYKIAFQEETSAGDLENYISDEIKAKYKIPEDAEAFETGARSAVYENSLGQIVAFTNKSACDQSYKSIGKNSNILPELYDLDEIEIEFENLPQKFCVIIMEKLTPLTNSERNEFRAVEGEFWAWKREITRQLENQVDPSKIDMNYPLTRGTVEEVAYVKLLKNMTDQEIEHTDLHSGNVAWGKNYDFKLIDWESIFVPEYWV